MLRPDADFRDITTTNTFTSSYDDSLPRSDRLSDEDRHSSGSPRPAMVHPGNDYYIHVTSRQSITDSDSSSIPPKPILATTSNTEQPALAVTQLQQVVLHSSVEDFRKLTAENTKNNRRDESTSSLASTTEKVCTLMMYYIDDVLH